jgi:hypothetical protein
MMNITMTLSPTTGLGMSEHGRTRIADVCAFVRGTAVSAAFGPMTQVVKSDVQGTGVSAYGITADRGLVDAFPGIPAWSPPI